MKKIILAAILIVLCCTAVCFAEEKPKIDLERVVITPSRVEQAYRESTANISIIESEDIEESGVEEVHQILETLPSVDIIEYGSNGANKAIHTRGAANSQVVTLVDGRLTNTPRDGITDFNKIPLNNIERIEVLRGPAASIYGANAIGGVINIITKSGKKEKRSEMEVRYGKEDTRIVNLLTQDEIDNFSWFFSGGWRRSSGFRENSDYKAWNVDADIDVDINDENKLNFAAGCWKSKLGTPGMITNEDLDDRQNARSDYFDISWDGVLWNDSNVHLKFYKNTDRLEFLESTTPYDIAAHTTKIYGATFQLSQVWFDIFRTTLGVDGQENRINSSSSAKHTYNVKAGYIETGFEPTEDINVKAGVRSDDYSNFGDRLSPSVSFSWWLFEKMKLHGLWAKSFRAPTFNDLYWPREDWGAWGGVEGDPDLNPETAKSYEVGVGTALFGALETDITYFHNKFKDMIAWQRQSDGWYRPTNVNKAIIKGIETNINYQPLDNLKTNFNYTYLEAEDTTTCNWLTYRPRNTYKTSITYLLNDKLTLFLTGRYLSRRYDNTTNTVLLKSYYVADGNLTWNANDITDLSLSVKNIFDQDYEEELNYPMPGTSITLGTKVKF